MKDKLMICYYDGLTIEQAVKFLEASYGIKVKEVSIKSAVETIKKYTGKAWK